ncbi:MAG TPA: type II toxin-antitoxin system death-on-curing family toxin [Acidobacteriaceae bacterium]
MKRWRWIRVDVLHAIHDRQIAEHGGPLGVLDAGRVEAALTHPRNLAAYESPDAATLAAAYAHRLARSHCFADGNKRTAWVAARLFLADNGFLLRYDPADAVRTMHSVAAGTVSESELATWFRQRMSRS